MTSPETVAQMASALAFIVERHRPDTFANGRDQDPSNRLLLEPPDASLQPGGVPSSWPDG